MGGPLGNRIAKAGSWARSLNPEQRLFWFLFAAAIGLGVALLAGRKPWDTNFLSEEASLRAVITAWMWLAAAFNLLSVGLLLATSRWWMRWAHQTPETGPSASRQLGATRSLRPSLFWIAVSVAALVLVAEALPRLQFSLWNDEEYVAIRNVFGRYVIEDGTARLERPDWQRTIWLYAKPTNHIPQTVASRVSMDIWLAVARPDGFAFREWVMRLPALFAGAAAVFLIAGLVRKAAGSIAGVAAALLLAVHPWFVRFSSEARGYSISLAALIAALWLLLLAFERSRWRDWLLYGFALLIAIAAYPGILCSMVLLNAAVVLMILLNREKTWQSRSMALTRWFLACSLAGMLFLQLMAPCIPQVLEYLETERYDRSMINSTWLANTASYLVSGVPWHAWEWTPGTVDLQHLVPTGRSEAIALGILILLVWLCGATFLLRKRPTLLVSLLAIAAGTAIAVILAERSTVPFWEWYVCQDLIPVVILTACAAPSMASFAAKPEIRNLITTIVAGVILIGYAVFEFPVHRLIRNASVLPLREAVLTMRGDLNPYARKQNEIRTLCFAHFPRLYDPRMELVKDPETLARIHRDAAAKGKQLFAMIYAKDRQHPGIKQIFAILDEKFVLVREFPGSQPIEAILVYKASP